jgi:gamma-glutamylcyclotransferase (GGCT)/AIG2-like uncharacterized protein YtfP
MAIAVVTRADRELRIEAASWLQRRGRVTPKAPVTTSDTVLAVSVLAASAFYFAYGSNMSPARMRDRIAGAEPLGAAQLVGFCLRLDKRGADGSGKANLGDDATQSVWGALYRIEASEWPRLDAFEADYERIAVEVEWRGAPQAAQTYRSHRLTEHAVPFVWYKRLLIEGARAHALPEAWIRRLELLPERTA